MKPKTLRERTNGFTVTAAQACSRKMNLRLGSDLTPIIDCLNHATLHGPPIELAIEVLEYIAKHGANFTERFDMIADEALEQLKEARG